MNRAWMGVAIASGLAFVALSLMHRYASDTLAAIDLVLTNAIAPFQSYVLIQGFLAITALGDVAGIVAIALGSAVFMRNHPCYVLMLTVALIGSTIMTNAVKLFVARMRPDTLLWLNPFLSFSFPSGHATASMTLFGFLAVVSARLMKEGRGRTAAIVLCIAAIVLVGLSRIFISAHFLTDVIGGWLLGLFWIALVLSLMRRAR